MLVLLAVHIVGASVAPACVRWWGRRAYYVLAAVPAAALAWCAAQAAPIRTSSPAVEELSWIPQLSLNLTLRMDTLSWLLAVLVTGAGALVLLYCAHYFEPDDPGLGRFAGSFLGFAGAMFGLVVSDNLILLYVFWELTTIFSYLLIGHWPQSEATRRAAGQALIVTTFGGLTMLVGLIMLGERSGTYRLSEIAARPPPTSGFLAVALVLILVGALSKSAIFPFSFWLPAAMVAPTPVSAYLHAAAMVKAGVYLIGAFSPSFAAVAPWRPIVIITGIVTMVFGAWAALRETDLKRLLAHATVSQLGFIAALVGTTTYPAALGGVAILLAHALFKATLFLVVGIIDHQAGTRDLRQLSGLWRSMPWTFVVAILGAASMAGIPPWYGFAAKEAALAAFVRPGLANQLILAGLVAGTVLTVAYTARFLWGGFATKPGREPTGVTEAKPAFIAPPAVLGLASLLLIIPLGQVDALLAPYARLAGTADAHLELWPGLTPPLGLSVLTIAAGLAMFAGRAVVARAVAAIRVPRSGDWTYGRIMRGLDRGAIALTGATQRGSLPFYLGTILSVLVIVIGVALLSGRFWENPGVAGRLVRWDSPVQPVVGALMVAAAVSAVRARRRLTAMLLVGLTGYGAATLFVLHGAPDLALTQFLVDTASIVVFVLVLRRLPAHFSLGLWRRVRWIRRGIGVLVGLVVAVLAALAIGSRNAPPISTQFPAAAVELGGGRNVVNVTLVDIRAWDTVSEISVLVVAATGVASLIFIRPRTGPLPRRGAAPRSGGQPPAGRWSWLAGAKALPPRQRSIIFEVVTRLLFHSLVLYSVFLLFSGHNGPGGGFSGGLLAGLALAIRYLAGGRHELNEAAPVDAGLLLGSGLLLSVGSGVVALLFGGQLLQSAQIDLHVPLIGEVHLVTSLFFDIGVYLVVIGLILDILRSVGSEVDRQTSDAAAARGEPS